MKLIPIEVVDKAVEEYSDEHQSYSGVPAFKAGVEFAEKEVLKHITEIIIENQGLKLFKDRNDAKFPNGVTSYLETYYEVISYIIFKNYAPENINLWELAEDITDAFELKNKDRVWDGEFFEEVTEFTHNYIPDAVNFVCAICGGSNIESRRWTDPNTKALTDRCVEEDDTNNWCNDCVSFVDFKTVKTNA